jgi:hypothetical protein
LSSSELSSSELTSSETDEKPTATHFRNQIRWATQKIVLKVHSRFDVLTCGRHNIHLKTRIDKNLTRCKHGSTKIWRAVNTDRQKFDARQTRIDVCDARQTRIDKNLTRQTRIDAFDARQTRIDKKFDAANTNQRFWHKSTKFDAVDTDQSFGHESTEFDAVDTDRRFWHELTKFDAVDTDRRCWHESTKFLTRWTWIDVFDTNRQNFWRGKHGSTKIWRGKHWSTKIWRAVDTDRQKFDEASVRVVRVEWVWVSLPEMRCHSKQHFKDLAVQSRRKEIL